MTRLVADVGGTNARFALADPEGRIGEPVVLATEDHESLGAAIRAFLGGAGDPRPEAAAVCAAGPVHEGTVRLTNAGWTITTAEIAEAAGVAAPLLVNDFTANAAAVPALGADDVRAIGGEPRDEGAPAVVLGPGTGLGVAALVPGSGQEIVVAGEGGHVTLAAGDEREAAILASMRARFGHVSAERAISGPGIENVHRAIAEIDDAGLAIDDAGAIARAAFEGRDEVALETIARFTGWLGSVAGDLALVFGARGGVFVAGGIVPSWGERFDAALFRERFERKGRFRGYLAAIPVFIITAPHPALLGLVRLLDRTARSAP